VRRFLARQIKLSTPSPTTPAGAASGAQDPNAPSAQEFRSYRRFLARAVLLIICLGSGYLLTSVGVGIYRERHPSLNGPPVSAHMTREELLGCWQELADEALELQERFEDLHDLLEGDKAQSWAEGVYRWRDRWHKLAQRCRLDGAGVVSRPKELDNMAAAYSELADMEAVYTKDLLRFGKELSPQLARLRKQIDSIGQRLERASAGDQPR
jgi:hypothetical protein